MSIRPLLLLFAVLGPSLVTHADVQFDVSVPAGKLEGLHDGRVVVYLVGPDRPLHRHERPASWDYCHEPMPLYAKDAKGLKAGDSVTIDGSADFFRTRLAELPPGEWSAQAVFDWHSDASGWSMEPDNLSSPVVPFTIAADRQVKVSLPLTEVVEPAKFDRQDVALIEVRSKLLSDFRHRDVMLRAGVVLPLDYDPKAKYAAVYDVPGFGGTHADALEATEDRASLKEKPPGEALRLATRTFHVFLDPESPNGHTLFADSDVNGPCGRALVEELIPAIEAKYPSLIRESRGRLLTGHSSGGWSVCWLQTHFNDVFGGAWPSSPDPIDFRKFELIDLYAAENFYTADGKELPSVRDEKGDVTLHVRDENAWEQTVAPDNTGGQQWQSWQAVFGLPRGDGHPKPLYDIRTGAIDRSQLDRYRKYDLCAQLKAEPSKYAPIWREKIRLIVGTADDYYLNEAVMLLRDELAKCPPTGTADANRGYITLVPGKTHDTIYETKEMERFDAEMLKAIGEK